MPPFSSIAMLMALTIVSVWALLEPWRGRDDQISIVPLSPPPPSSPHAAEGEHGDGGKRPNLLVLHPLSS